MIVDLSENAWEGVINIKHLPARSLGKQGTVNPLPSSADTVDVYDACRRARVRRESEGVNSTREPVARPIYGFGQRCDSPAIADEYMIEAQERVKPILVPGNRRRPELVNPAHTSFAAFPPSVDGIHVKKIPPSLAVGHEKVILARELNFAETRVGKD